MRGRTREVIRTAMNERKNQRGDQDSYEREEEQER